MDLSPVKYSGRTVGTVRPDGLASGGDSGNIRDNLMPWPDSGDDSPRKILILGTFGFGKSSLMCQLLGTVGESTGFPAVAPGKTTIAPTEVICDPSPVFKAVVTFAPRWQIAETCRQNLADACVAAARGGDDHLVGQRILTHRDERIRLAFVIGEYKDPARLAAGKRPPSEEKLRWIIAGQDHIQDLIDRVRKVAQGLDLSELESVGGQDDGEGVTADELVAGLTGFDGLVEDLLGVVEERIGSIETAGEFEFDAGWPEVWTYSSEDRAGFLEELDTFTGNADVFKGRRHMLGRLMTPLVDGVRVRGPFKPDWHEHVTPLVLLDTQGLGHDDPRTKKQKRLGSLSPRTVQWIKQADGVLLVDHSLNRYREHTQLVLSSMAQMGLTSRLFLLHTQMDVIVGGPVRDSEDARDHVRASQENFLTSVEPRLGARRTGKLRERLGQHTYYAGRLNRALDPDDEDDAETMEQLDALLGELWTLQPAPEPLPIVPVYSRAQVKTALEAAAAALAKDWEGVVGYYEPMGRWVSGGSYWSTIKALTNHVGNLFEHGWRDLEPAGDVRDQLLEHLNAMLERPVDWEGNPTEDEQGQALGDIADKISETMILPLNKIAYQRTITAQRSAWVRAFDLRGQGSSRIRAARIIEILKAAIAGSSEPGLPPIHAEIVKEFKKLKRADGGPLLEIRG